MASDEVASLTLDGLDSPVERVGSEQECDLMIEALSKELSVVRVSKIAHILLTS